MKASVMDYSAVSTYENISDIKDCSESVLYHAVNNVLSVTTTNGNKMFCPLCVKTLEYKFSFLDHLKNVHYHFLRRATEKSFTFEQCPFCYANFFGMHTIVKHALQTHSKLITHLYLQAGEDADPERYKCLFCSDLYRRKSAIEFVSHIENRHFLQFTELFQEQFMKANESVLSAKTNPANDLQKLNPQSSPSCSPIHKQNHFDFSNLKEQLCHVECNNSDLKSILKSNKTKVDKPSPSKNRRVCRVLKFDLADENKENSVLTHNMLSEKHLTAAEHSLLCNNKTKELFNDGTSYSNADIQPIHCSTPKNNTCRSDIKSSNKKIKPKLKRKLKLRKKATFTSYFFTKDFAFQCGKCKQLFQENIELHSHIKKNHKLFILNLLHPCYQCAICQAKFFKNYYLKKHIVLHTSNRESLPEH